MSEGKSPTDLGPDLGHDYDGIRELDNRLPNWWVATFVATLLFGLGYWYYFHLFRVGPSSADELAAEQAQAAAAAPPKAKELTEEQYLAMAKDPAALKAGREVFEKFCVACHGTQANGMVGTVVGIGPNLTDSYWIHAKGTARGIRAVVTDGVLAKGMPTWGPSLGAEKVNQVTAYVVSLAGTNVPGKPAQGDLIAPGGGAAPTPEGGAAPAPEGKALAAPAGAAPPGAPAGEPPWAAGSPAAK